MERELADSLEALHADAFGWAVHCCHGDPVKAEDVLQAAYFKLVTGRAAPSGGSSLKTWWFGVIRLTGREEFRRQRYRESLMGRLLAKWTGGPEPRPTPVRCIEMEEQAREVRAALAQLPPRQAEVLHLVFYQDLPLTEAALVMQIGVGSARQHYERGKTRLRALLQPSQLTHEY